MPPLPARFKIKDKLCPSCYKRKVCCKDCRRCQDHCHCDKWDEKKISSVVYDFMQTIKKSIQKIYDEHNPSDPPLDPNIVMQDAIEIASRGLEDFMKSAGIIEPDDPQE
jgi:hypothetical protein